MRLRAQERASLSRGNPAVEAVLDSGRAYTSGAEWLREQVLPGRDVLAVAGTHGKTTTTPLLAWLLQATGRDPGFLIGGVAEDLGVSARLGSGREFVVEADEYDTAFFDKRSKFVHYRPLVAILNNLEYDHADIFPDIAAIQRQFHHLVRTVPGRGRLIVNGHDAHLREVLAMGCWTPVERFGFDAAFEWSARKLADDGSRFVVARDGVDVGIVEWSLLGDHNVLNGLAALAACAAVGVDVDGAGVARELAVPGEGRDRVVDVAVDAVGVAGLEQNIGHLAVPVVPCPPSHTSRYELASPCRLSCCGLQSASEADLRIGNTDASSSSVRQRFSRVVA